MKVIFLLTLILFKPSLAEDLNERLWRELDTALHRTQKPQVQEANELSWDTKENVDEVMAQYQKEKAPQFSEDSVSFGMAGLKKPEAPAPQEKRAQQEYQMTRSRSR